MYIHISLRISEGTGTDGTHANVPLFLACALNDYFLTYY